MRTLTLVSLALLTLASAAPAQAADPVAIRAGKVLTGTGKTLTDAVIWVDGGKITRITTGEKIPAGTTIIDHSDDTLIPGLVAAGTSIAVAGGANDQSSEVTPAFRVAGSLDASHRTVDQALQRGITTAHVRPGLDNVIGGFGAIVRPGHRGEAFVIDDQHDLLIPIGPWPSSGNMSPDWSGTETAMARRPTTRMALIWIIRKSFHDARVFARTGEIGDLQKETPGAYTEQELRILAGAMTGKTTVRFFARGDRDVRAALRITREFGLKRIRIEGLIEGYRGPEALDNLDAGLVVEVMASTPLSATTPVNARPLPMQVAAAKAWFEGTHDPGCACCGMMLGARGVGGSAAGGVDDPTVVTPSYGPRADNARQMIARNPRTALSTRDGVPDLLQAAAYAVRHGLDEQAALAAITRVPAQQLGLSRKVGTIAPGRHADFVALSGAPFEITSRVVAVYTDGRRVFALEDLLR